MKKLKYSGYYAPLDLLLDTRMGTLARMSEEVAANLDLKWYRERQNDRFEPFTLQEFNDAYAKRDTETLKFSLPTPFFQILRDEIQRSSMSNGKEFTPEMARVYVNTYPYELDEAEVTMLGTILVNLFRTEDIEIELISKSLEELTVDYCLDNFVFMAMYQEYHNWMDLHYLSMKEKRAAGILLMAPAIFNREMPTDEEIKASVAEVGLHPLEMIEMQAKELVDLTLIDIKHFSVIEFGGIKPASPDAGPLPLTP